MNYTLQCYLNNLKEFLTCIFCYVCVGFPLVLQDMHIKVSGDSKLFPFVNVWVDLSGSIPTSYQQLINQGIVLLEIITSTENDWIEECNNGQYQKRENKQTKVGNLKLTRGEVDLQVSFIFVFSRSPWSTTLLKIQFGIIKNSLTWSCMKMNTTVNPDRKSNLTLTKDAVTVKLTWYGPSCYD